jgi:pimeloyl-ACP methyl ester carboxylesterase
MKVPDSQVVAFLKVTDGVRLKYEVEGDGPALLLHLGAGCDSDLWGAAGYVEPLAREHRCILFDHRGHGESDRPRGPAANHVDRYVEDVIALLDELGVERAAFWGYSNGIVVGLKAVEEHPARFSALVGSGAISRLNLAQLAESLPRRIAERREFGWEKMIEGFDEEEVHPVPTWMKDRIRATDIEQTIDWSRAILEWNWDPWESLRWITAPTLFVVGELEDPDDSMAEAAATMQDASRFRIQEQGHINAFLRSDLVLPRVLTFLAGAEEAT